jgi:hypothetical protein
MLKTYRVAAQLVASRVVLSSTDLVTISLHLKKKLIADRGPGFDFLRCQISWVTVSLEPGPLSLVRINEGIFEWKGSGSGLENWD